MEAVDILALVKDGGWAGVLVWLVMRVSALLDKLGQFLDGADKHRTALLETAGKSEGHLAALRSALA